MTDPEKLARASSIENEVVVARGARMSEDMNEGSGGTYCFSRRTLTYRERNSKREYSSIISIQQSMR